MLHLLFPEGTHEMLPTEEFITAYDSSLGQVLSQDGIIYYTEDPVVIQYRMELFQEIIGNPALLTAMKEFTEQYTLPDNDINTTSQLLKKITLYKKNMEAILNLKEILHSYTLQSNAINTLKIWLNKIVETPAWHSMAETFEKLPQDLTHIKSLTLGINLDREGNPLEAGIVSINSYAYVSNSPLEKLLRFGEELHNAEPLVKPDKEHPDLYGHLLHEMMYAADRLIVKELKKLHVNRKHLLMKIPEIEQNFLDEMQFATELAAVLMCLCEYGIQIRFGGYGDENEFLYTIDLPGTLEKIKLHYTDPVVYDPERFANKSLIVFGIAI